MQLHFKIESVMIFFVLYTTLGRVFPTQIKYSNNPPTSRNFARSSTDRCHCLRWNRSTLDVMVEWWRKRFWIYILLPRFLPSKILFIINYKLKNGPTYFRSIKSWSQLDFAVYWGQDVHLDVECLIWMW